jgi:predicted ATP-grasp superfamily ATP-dependent carboligase
VVAPPRLAPGLWSRIPAARKLAPDPRRDVRGFVDRLGSLLQDNRYSILLAGTDASLLAISRHRDRLAPYVCLGLPTQEVVERALDKWFLVESAAQVGLDPPETRLCTGAADAVGAAAAFRYPVVVKPHHTADEGHGIVRRWGSVLAFNEAVVSAAARSFGTCLVQRRVDGDVISFAGVAANWGLLATVVSRYVRTWPPEGGNVCFSETIATPHGLANKVQSLLARLGWTGVFELEMIERGNGHFAAIDFNPRVYGSQSLAVAARAPLPAVWCDWLLGCTPRGRGSVLLGARYRWEDADIAHSLLCLRNRRPRAALEIARPRRHVTHAYFELCDPAPLIARTAQVVHQTVTRQLTGRKGLGC